MKSNFKLVLSTLLFAPTVFSMAPDGETCVTRLIDQLEKPILHLKSGNLDAVKSHTGSQTQLNALLTFAVLSRKIEMVETLLDQGAQISANPTALTLAIQIGEDTIIQLLKSKLQK